MHALRALVNLLENAVKYSPPESRIDLSVYREGEALIFTVALIARSLAFPSWSGIVSFEPFYRPRGTPPDTRGAGLGLTIARGLANAQGGDILYEDRPGGGSVFSLVLPAVVTSPSQQF